MNLFSKRVLLVVAIPVLMGCWQEVHFDPSAESPAQIPAVFANSKRPSTGPANEQMFGSTERYASSTQSAENDDAQAAAIAATEPDQPTAELPDPVWNEPSAETISISSAEPAPPAELDWLEDEPAEAPSAVPLAAAWQLGSKWSLAIGIYGKGYGSDRYGNVVSKAKQAADDLGIYVPAIPAESGQPLVTAIRTLRESDGPRLIEAIGESHSAEHEALCHLAIITHALLLDYATDSNTIDRTSEEVNQLAIGAKLPERLWQPVIDALNDRSDFADVKQAVLKLHRETAKHLDNL